MSDGSPTSAARPTGRDEITDAVLDAAERLFAAAGPSEVSLRAIATEAGVTYGLVYRHFGTKDALLERLLIRYADRWKTHLGGEPDYSSALEDLLGGDFDTGPYLKLLSWRFFNPFIRAALHLEDQPPEAVQAAIRDQLRGLIDPN
jgi:AcrR family transcriptional regulator